MAHELLNTIPEQQFAATSFAERINSGVRAKLARVAAISLLTLGCTAALTVEETLHPAAAYADTLGYPYPTDTEAPCEYGSAGGASCANPNNPNDQYNWGVFDANHVFHPYREGGGYEYRNCTDYVAWKLESLGVASSDVNGLGNGGQWYSNAPVSKRSLTPKAGDAAVSTSGTFGHVAFVESVNSVDPNNASNDNITVSEYNHSTHGDGDTRTGTASSLGFSEYVDFGVNYNPNPNPSGLREPSAIEDPASGRNIFYVGADNNVWQWSVISNQWANVKLLDGSSAEQVATGTSPSAVEDSATGRNIFYVGADNAIWQWSVQNGAWHNNRLGGNVRSGTSPSAVVDPSSGRNVFFVDANGGIDQLSVQNNQWVNIPIGGVALAGTSPSAIEDPSTGRNVFYEGLDSRISQLSIMTNQWVNVELNDPVGNQTLAPGSSPNAVEDPNTGRNIFYAGADNRIWQYSVQSGAWHNNKLIDSSGNQTVEAGTSPNSVYDSTSGRNIFYTGPDNQIWQYSVQLGAWHNFKLTGAGGNPAVDTGTSPGAMVDPATGRNIFYFNNGSIWQWSVQNNTWTNFLL